MFEDGGRLCNVFVEKVSPFAGKFPFFNVRYPARAVLTISSHRAGLRG